jgi:3-oxoacyl-[acyl-carrier-protein] synthase-3
MSVKLGNVNKAIATGSERFSAAIRSDVFEDEVQKLVELEENPYISFDKDFLRWMLSDGAAAFQMSNKPNEHGISLRVDWVDGVSYANEMDPCMYAGSEKENGILKGYLDYTPDEMLQKSVLSIKQDVKLLSENIVPLGGRGLKDTCERNGLDIKDIDHFLPHMSSEFFKQKIYDRLAEIGLFVSWEKWYTCLSEVGNVGAGYIYLAVDQLFHSGQLKKGQKILLLVPESSRFSYMYSCLTVV